jgi:hypothetical protein
LLSIILAVTVFTKWSLKTENYVRLTTLIARMICQSIALYLVFGLKTNDYHIIQGFWIITDFYVLSFLLVYQIWAQCFTHKYENKENELKR